MMVFQKQKYLLKCNLVTLLILIALFVSSCGDPAIYYQPKDWIKEEHPWFAKSFGDLDLKMSDIGGITINNHITPEVMIYNRGKSTVILERALLKAGGKEYSAHPFDNKAWEAIPSNETRRLALDIEFSKTIEKVLNEPVEIILMLRIGNELSKISIPMIERKLEN